MGTVVQACRLRKERDAVIARRRARDLAALLQLAPAVQINLAAAVWELAGVALPHGTVELAVGVEVDARALDVTITGVPRTELDLDFVRHLVSRTAVREVADTAIVRLTAPVSNDAWIPGMDELELVLASLTRDDLWRLSRER